MMQAGQMKTDKKVLGIQQILEWAFGREHARLETDPYMQIGGIGLPGISMEYILMERMRLGGIRIDTSVGRSYPHDDAEVVAAILERLPDARGGMPMAIQIAEYARAGITPDWLPGARTRVVPCGWRETKHGRYALTELVATVSYKHRGRKVSREVRCCPVTYTPSASKIAASRRGYLDWWGALRDLRLSLQAIDLRAHIVSDVMPPMKPWERG